VSLPRACSAKHASSGAIFRTSTVSPFLSGDTSLETRQVALNGNWILSRNVR